jgi:hypothetical protein
MWRQSRDRSHVLINNLIQSNPAFTIHNSTMPNTIEQGPSKNVNSLDLKGLKEIKMPQGGTVLVPAVSHSILSSEMADQMNVDQAEGGVRPLQ